MQKTLGNAKSIGLVLSGGGVRGMAHIGLIKALEEHKIEVNRIAGSSVGALVGALYANNKGCDEMLQFFKETPLFQYSFFAIGKPGLVDTERYYPIFERYFPENDFAALKKPLIVVATDLMDGDEKVFNSGELILPLLASAALTPFFSPVSIQGTLYADGGIMNNFPKEYIDNHCDYVIGSNVSITARVHNNELKNSIQLAGRVTGLMIYATNRAKIEACDLLCEPKDLTQIGVLDKKGIERAFVIGYDHAMFKLDSLLH